MRFEEVALAVISLLLTAQSAYAVVTMLYAWEDEEKRQLNASPDSFEPPLNSFTVLLPARHEEPVIQDTIQHVVDFNYPRGLIQVLVVIESGDAGTIAKVREKLWELHLQGVSHVELLTFDDPPINKPHGLNIGLAAATGDVVTIFDAEDEPHPDILNLVNSVMLREDTQVVQSGVQLMNYADNWYSTLNVLEYFFWFKSRLHCYSTQGVVPLGGNTIFIRRPLLEKLGGWDQNCLTEDADIGITIGAAGVPVRVLYDDRYITREETPPTVGHFLRQRTRWDQGFIQVLRKGEWLHFPTFRHQALAFYTLSFPLFQAFLMTYLPLSIWMTLSVKMPGLVVMLSTLPVYMLLIQFIINLIGLYEFTSAHKLTPSKTSPLRLAISYLPYQWLLGFAAVRAVWREMRGINNWEKTAHVGAHRVAARPAVAAAEPVLVTPELVRE